MHIMLHISLCNLSAQAIEGFVELCRFLDMHAWQTSHESVRPLPHAQFKTKSLPPGHQIRQHLAGQLLILMHSESDE